MRRTRCEPARPYGGRHYELVHTGHEGTYWAAEEGIVVRLATSERVLVTACQRTSLAIVPFVLAFCGVSRRRDERPVGRPPGTSRSECY
jgi:hypothetical protein